jgi:hypothetical protein
MDQRRVQSMVDRPPWPATELNGARLSGHSRARRHCRSKGKWRGRRDAAGGLSTEAWTTARKWHTGGGALAQSGNDVGSKERRRGQDDGVRVFRQEQDPFIRLGEGTEVVKEGLWLVTRWRSMAE